MKFITTFLYPTTQKIKFFLLSFLIVHILNLGTVFLVMGFWDGGLSLGFPFGFYTVNCGLDVSGMPCPYGIHLNSLGLDLISYYLLATVIKRK